MTWQYIAAFVFYSDGVGRPVKLDLGVWRHQQTLGDTNLYVVLIQARMCQKHRLKSLQYGDELVLAVSDT